MKGTFSEIIRSSWEWTKTVLFRPFSLKKWIFLCIIAILAAEISGCNLNLNINIPAEKPKEEMVQAGVISPSPSPSSEEQGSPNPLPVGERSISMWLILAIIAGIIIGLALLILFMWIYSRFSFIFLNSIVKNDASIKGPFRENKSIGNSFFKWNIALFCIFVGVVILIALLAGGTIYLFRNVSILWKILLIIIPWALIALAIIIIFSILNLIVRDLVLPVMFKNREGIINGWREIIPVIKREKLNLIKYILIKLGLRILTAILAGFFAMAVMFALLIQFGVIGGVLYSASFLLPEFLRLGYYVLLILLGVICLIGIIILVNLALLPVPVYFRSFSLKFLAGLDQRYDLFRLMPGKEDV